MGVESWRVWSSGSKAKAEEERIAKTAEREQEVVGLIFDVKLSCAEYEGQR